MWIVGIAHHFLYLSLPLIWDFRKFEIKFKFIHRVEGTHFHIHIYIFPIVSWIRHSKALKYLHHFPFQWERKSVDLSKGWAVSDDEFSPKFVLTYWIMMMMIWCFSVLLQECVAELWISIFQWWGKRNMLC